MTPSGPGRKVTEVNASPITEERGPLDPPHHHVVQGVRRIEPRLAGHSTAASPTRRQKMKRILALDLGAPDLRLMPLLHSSGVYILPYVG
jgi:hypothetical protein